MVLLTWEDIKVKQEINYKIEVEEELNLQIIDRITAIIQSKTILK